MGSVRGFFFLGSQVFFGAVGLFFWAVGFFLLVLGCLDRRWVFSMGGLWFVVVVLEEVEVMVEEVVVEEVVVGGCFVKRTNLLKKHKNKRKKHT